jgi:rhodanese-related sulfurtransferase/CBS domain-containing protein
VVKQVTTHEVQQLLEAGAQLVDVLPAETFVEEHLPGALNLPMADIASAPDVLDSAKAVIVYCYDHQCDLSSRAAARLASMNFSEVYDYVDSKVAWLAEGLPSAGLVDDSRRAISRLHTDVPSVGPGTRLGELPDAADDWEVVAVTDEHNVVLGLLRREADDLAPDTPVAAVMQAAPPTVRPSIPLRELAETMDKNGEAFLLVTKLDGQLMGLVRRAELDAA